MRYSNKQFLSTDPADADESGSMVCTVTFDKYEDLYDHSARNTTIEGSIMVRDCYGKPTTIDLSVRSDNGLQRRIKKLTLMIDMLTEMREKLPKFWEEAKANGERWVIEHKDDTPTTSTQVKDIMEELDIPSRRE